MADFKKHTAKALEDYVKRQTAYAYRQTKRKRNAWRDSEFAMYVADVVEAAGRAMQELGEEGFMKYFSEISKAETMRLNNLPFNR